MNKFPKVAQSIILSAVFGSLLLQTVMAEEAKPVAAQPGASAAGSAADTADAKTSATVTPVSASSDDSVSTKKTAVAKANKPKEDLPNFHQVHPFLYRSGEPTEAGLKKLKEMGVKTLIDLRAPSEFPINEPKIAKELGLNYINLVMTSKAPTEKQVDTMLKEIKKAQEKPENGSVLVHCAHGSDRTGCMVGIWRVTQEGWSYDDTYKEMRKYWFTPKFTNLSNAVKERASK
jgi:protein tyrosine phosphatase (PTP) superfamily phosphohydrolase (DUF442 family)